ncbi:MAG TPA: transcriptional regulator [Acetobacteraceae bacterium]|nr:transcriptional regulator [Acetobacteraceae bacterium]
MQAFSFGPFRVVPYSRLLERSGSPVPVGSRAFDILCLLISRPGEVVSKDELMARAWPDATVEESNLRLNIYALRRVLGDRQGGIQYVVNVPGRGYCFAANVEREAAW